VKIKDIEIGSPMLNKKIAYQGVPGAFSWLAGIKFFGRRNKFISVDEFKKIFELVVNKKADYGIVPIENTLAGSIYENYDNLNIYNVKIYGEISLKIEHHLLGIKTNLPFSRRIKLIKKVFSHPKALEQCQKFFEKYPWIEKVGYKDTAGSAKYVAELKDISLGSIASKEAAKIYGLEIIKENIEDDKNNFTRFLIISREENKNLKKLNKGSLIFYLPHIPGSLYKSLKPFAENGINLTKIESRPIKGRPFEYVFYIDFEFSKKDLNRVLDALEEFKKLVKRYKFLGFYPIN
jgi:prephenate dehydratase